MSSVMEIQIKILISATPMIFYDKFQLKKIINITLYKENYFFLLKILTLE